MWREPIVNQFPYVMLLQRRILGDEAHCQAPRRMTWCSWQSAKAMENLVYFVEANERPPCASKAKRHNLVNLGSFCRSPTLQADSNVWNFHVSRAHHSHQSHPRLLRSAPLFAIHLDSYGQPKRQPASKTPGKGFRVSFSLATKTWVHYAVHEHCTDVRPRPLHRRFPK